jgi:hypothetical protein
MSGTLVVAGTAGSVIVAKINSDSVEKEVEVLVLLIVAFLYVKLVLPVVKCSFGACWKIQQTDLKLKYIFSLESWQIFLYLYTSL